VETLYESQAARGWSRDFYDDENWMALALLRAHALTNEAKYLTEARALLDDIVGTAWGGSACGAQGNFWDRAHSQKATAANAGPVITAARMTAATGEQKYLAYARRLYAAWKASALQSNDAVIDHYDCQTGQAVHWRFTYNEGLMIGAALELYHAGGEPTYLDDARAIAHRMALDETRPGESGRVLFDGTDAHCGSDCAQFKGIGYRYLAELARIDPANTEARSVLDASAANLWDIARDPSRGLFGVDWLTAAGAPFLIEAQSSAAMTLSIHAALTGPTPPSSLGSATVLEAEEATLHGLGLEARYAGFTGFGYVAGWNGDGQWIDFHPVVSAPGMHHLQVRYAAGAGDAERYIYVNGHGVIDRQRFASTGGWSTYRTVAFDVPLAAGRNTVSIIFDGSRGSTGWLNLDHLEDDN
jgi:predicted alpha-1,6-mannanase (GH76 family)